MNSRRIRTSSRFSALSLFRICRQVIGARQAYWLVVCRYGWKAQSSFAWDMLNPTAKRICAQA